MTISRTAALVAVMALLWTFAGAAREARGQPGGTPALESAEATLELTRSERRRIQLGLAAAGFDPGPADGLFGRATRGAIRKWQASLGQAATGYLDADAARALLAAGKRREATTASKPKPPTPPTGSGAEPGSGILRDKYVLGLGQALKADDYPKALEFIDRIEKLGGDLPPALDYFRGESYFHTKRYDEAQRALNRYVKKTGKKGRYYRKSLEFMLASEEKSKAAQAVLDKAKKKLEEQIQYLINKLTKPYSDIGDASNFRYGIKKIYKPGKRFPIRRRAIIGGYSIRYRYRHRLRVAKRSPSIIVLEYGEGSRYVYSTEGMKKYYREYRKYKTEALKIPYTKIRNPWPKVNKIIDFTKNFSFANFGRMPCPPRMGVLCPDDRPYVMHLNGIVIVHKKDHIVRIYRRLKRIDELAKASGYPGRPE